MGLYGGIDLHARNSYLTIVDEDRDAVFQKRLSNDLEVILAALEPYREEIKGVAIESTFNWFWLVDGLMDEGYEVHLVNTNAARQYDGLKYADDRHDARWLASMLCLGILPEGYVYPREERPLRDLCRRRTFLVQTRTSLLTSARGTFASWTGQNVRGTEMAKWSEDDFEVLVPEPMVRLGFSCLLEPVNTINEQIRLLEKEVLARAKLREEFRKLKTIWGIGDILALTIMYEVGDISRFADVGNFVSYCRLVRTDRRSDTKSKGKGNRKNGNAYLSWAFSEATYYAGARPAAKKFLEGKKRTTNAMVARRALAHKLGRAAYYVVRDRVDFDPDRLFR